MFVAAAMKIADQLAQFDFILTRCNVFACYMC